MDSHSSPRPRVSLAFWAACVVAAAGAVGPVVLAGTGGRLSAVFFPFFFAAILFAASALLHPGRPVATALYFVAGLAIVYGILAMIAVELRLAVGGTCPPAPSACGLGLTDAESAGLSFAVAAGIVSILIGFFGLAAIYRRARHSVATPRAEHNTAPPVRRIPPVTSRSVQASPPVETAEPAVALPTAETAVTTPATATEQAELEAPPEQPELPAPAEHLELPAPTAEEMGETGLVTPQPEPPEKPRRRRRHNAPADAPPPPTDAL